MKSSLMTCRIFHLAASKNAVALQAGVVWAAAAQAHALTHDGWGVLPAMKLQGCLSLKLEAEVCRARACFYLVEDY